jgi:hypothetical protein
VNDLNPSFAFNLLLDYHFERLQCLRFYVVDVDGTSKEKKDHDALGQCQCSVAQIVSAANSKLTLPITGTPQKGATLTVVAEEVAQSRDTLTFTMSAKGIDKKDFFGKSDGFLVFKRAIEGGSFVAVHKTEVVMNSLNPVWRPITLPLTTLANGDWERPLLIELWDWDANSEPDFIGSCNTKPSALRALAASGSAIELINAAKQSKKGKKYTNSGSLFVSAFSVEVTHTFLDYVRSGTAIGCVFAIDFTASNGEPQYSSSLHYINPYQMNPYQRAIVSVGSVVLEYDNDKMVPAYGFGAKIPPNATTSHCFPLNFNPSNPEVPAIPGVMAAYQNVLATSSLYGPTNFAPTIDQAIQISKFRAGEYIILLIITDGVISDEAKTIDKIVEASNYPISIIIVGVGAADFKQMVVLDGDGKRLRSSNGALASHDNVQFVEFAKFESQPVSALAAEVLYEVPGQFLAHAKAHNIKPRGM